MPALSRFQWLLSAGPFTPAQADAWDRRRRREIADEVRRAREEELRRSRYADTVDNWICHNHAMEGIWSDILFFPIPDTLGPFDVVCNFWVRAEEVR